MGGEERLAERRADAHDDDRVEVVLCVRDHEESYPARSRSIRHSDDEETRRSPGHYARGDGTEWLLSMHEKRSAAKRRL